MTLVLAAVVNVSGQNTKIPLDRGFIDKTIAYYYGRQVRLHPAVRVFFVERDSVNRDAKTDYGLFKVQFISKEEMPAHLAKYSQHKAPLDRIVIRWVSLDTLDVAITNCFVVVKTVTKIENGQTATVTEKSIGDCLSEDPAIPACRFVYDQPRSSWTQLAEKK
jgi:hypothetical protein